MMKALLALACLMSVSVPAFAADEAAYERVMTQRTLRCAYSLWPTYIEIDPNTKQMSGLWYDYVSELGKLLDLKVEWTEEVGFGEIAAGLQAGRYDAFCGGLWQDVTQSQQLDYTIPISFQVIVPVVRADDHRFDKDVTRADRKEIKIASIDGEMSDIVRKSDFTQATAVSLPQLTEPSQLFSSIVARKADLTFSSPETVARFNEGNPGSLRAVAPEKPLRVFAEVLAVNLGEEKLRNILSYGTYELLNRGSIDKMLTKHEKTPNSFYRVAKPYQVPEGVR